MMRTRRTKTWLLGVGVLACCGGAACNALTGVEDLTFDNDVGQGGDGTGAGNTGTGNNGQGGDTTTTTPTPQYEDAAGVTITAIDLYQGTKRPIWSNGALANTSVPIVANREGLLRVSVATDANYNGQPVTARLYANGGAVPQELTGPVNGSPSDGALQSTINFKLTGQDISSTFSVRIELVQPPEQSKGPNPGAHFPADGFQSLNAQNSGQTLKITLVPVAYGADGSNRLPDTSQPQIDGYRNAFYTMYPAPEVQITVRSPFQYDGFVSPNGSGWDSLLNAIGGLRGDDNAPFDVYYFGIFEPANDVNQFCGGGCVAGLGNIGSAGDPYSRSAIGLGFSGPIAWETAVHEVGHNHGRYHAPCGGAAGTDPQFPYNGGSIGAWGYNVLTGQLYSPQNTADLMGYCQPIWVSDYTFTAFFQRIKEVNNANIYVPPEQKGLTYDRVQVGADGNLTWLSPVKLDMPPTADVVDVTVGTPDGEQHDVEAHVYEYDHLPGGVLLWPQLGTPSAAIGLNVAGQWKVLVR